MGKGLFKKGRYVFVLWACLISLTAHAMLHLELTQGASEQIPIGWQPFSAPPSLKDQAATLSAVLQADLQHSGEFRWVSHGSELDYWLQASIKQTAKGGIIHLKLWQVLDEQGIETLAKHKPFWQQALHYQKDDDMRTLAHRLSDAVYEAIIGQKGIFSTHLAYVLVQQVKGHATYSLQISDVDGHRPQEILRSPEPIMSPAWSFDGKHLAYVSFETLHPGIYVQNILTGTRRLVAQFDGINGAPAFSPSGDQLAIVLSKGGSPSLYLLDLKKQQLRALTHGWSLDTEPFWHPSGNALLFTSNRGGSPQIYALDLASNKVNRLTYKGRYNVHPSMDQKGRFLIYLHNNEGVLSIVRQSYPAGEVRTLVAMGQNQSPSLAPNGRMVLYTAPYKGKRTLFMVSVNGSVHVRLPTPEGEVQSPAWSPYSMQS